MSWQRDAGLALLVVLVLTIIIVSWPTCDSDASPKSVSTEFIKGYNKGNSFCMSPKKKCYKSYRSGIQKMHERYGPWCWLYSPWEYIKCLSRLWLESRGNPWSRTKSTNPAEAGIASTSQETAIRLKDMGYGGDPCGDPKWSIAANAFQSMEQRKAMLEKPCEKAKLPCWSDWLPTQFEDNRIEAEYFIGACGSTNCWKVRKAVHYANQEADILERVGKDGKMHVWWYMINYLSKQTQAKLAVIFEPMKVSYWRFGSRWGRVMAGKKLIAEFFPQVEGESTNYCWDDDEPYYFPMIPIVDDEGDGAVVEAYEMDMPTALFPYPKKGQWRARCHLFGTKGWKKAWPDLEPKRNDKWTKGGMKYHYVTGDPINVKKGEKKWKTDEEFQAAWEHWKDEMQEQRLLPSDEEYATWEQEMDEAGCAFQYPDLD